MLQGDLDKMRSRFDMQSDLMPLQRLMSCRGVIKSIFIGLYLSNLSSPACNPWSKS